MLNPDGSIRYESPTMERVTGYSPEELIGTSAFDLIHPRGSRGRSSRASSSSAPPPPDAYYEPVYYRWRHADGHWLDMVTSGTLLYEDGELHSILMISRDITAMRQRERELLERLEALERRLDEREAPPLEGAAAASGDDERGPQALEDPLAALLERTPHAALARMDDAEAMPEPLSNSALFQRPERWEAARALLWRALQSGHPQAGELTLEGVDELVVAAPVDRARVLVLSAAQPTPTSLPSTPLLLEAFDHQLRTPLNTIQGYAELLLEEALEGPHQRDLRRLRAAGRELHHLLDNLVELSRIQEQAISVRLEHIPLDELCDELREHATPWLEERGATLSCAFEPGVGALYTDRPRLLAGTLQLVRVMTRHGDHVHILSRPLPQQGEEGDEVELIFEARGATPDPDTLAELEEALEGIALREQGVAPASGTQLELHVCARRFELLGGSLRLHRSPGLTLCGRLPVISPRRHEPQRGPAPGRPHDEATGRPLALLIDDDARVHDKLGAWLAPTGYHLLHADSGAEGLRWARAYLPDVIVLDIIMPSIDGWSLLHQLRRAPSTRAIPVLTYSRLRDEELALGLGANAHLTKPATPAQLREALDELTASGDERHEAQEE